MRCVYSFYLQQIFMRCQKTSNGLPDIQMELEKTLIPWDG